MNIASKRQSLFGGDKAWASSDWTASDDRVRGGSSQSYLDCAADKPTALFHGTLDTSTLGGAGFASQRTNWEDRTLDLSAYDGIEIEIVGGDSKRYTFIIKDKLLARNPDNGREQSTISYEYDFQIPKYLESANDSSVQLFIPWEELQPTYRGKEKKDAPKLDLKNIKRFSIMCRSFFDKQDGDFKLELRSIYASSEPPSSKHKQDTSTVVHDNLKRDGKHISDTDPEKALHAENHPSEKAVIGPLSNGVNKLAKLSTVQLFIALTFFGAIIVLSKGCISKDSRSLASDW